MYRALNAQDTAAFLQRHPFGQIPPQGAQVCETDHCYLIFDKTNGTRLVIDLGGQQLPPLGGHEDWWGTFWSEAAKALPGQAITILTGVGRLPQELAKKAFNPWIIALVLGTVIVVGFVILRK